MFINKTKKKENKILKFLAMLSCLLNVAFVLFSRFSILFENRVYEISYIDILFNYGIKSDDNYLIFPYYFQSAVSFSIMTCLSSMFFIFIKRLRKSFILMSFVLLPSILSIVLHFTNILKLYDFNIIYLHILFSLITLLIHLIVIGLESTVRNILRVITFFCISVSLIIVLYLSYEGLPVIFKIGFFRFLFGIKWSPSNNLFGILPFILCSIIVTLCSVVIGGFFGILAATFLVLFIPNRLSKIMKIFVQVSSGIPSIVYGFFGMLIVVPIIEKLFKGHTTGDSLLAAIIILSIMILPTIICMSEEAIKAVPKSYLEASLSLGVSRVKSIFKIVFPEAKEGIMSGVFLGVGRAIGETMAVIMVSGNAVNLPNFLKPVRFLTTSMALEFSYASGIHRKALFATGLILFLIICLINTIFIRIVSLQKINR